VQKSPSCLITPSIVPFPFQNRINFAVRRYMYTVPGDDWHRPLDLLCNQSHAALVSEGLSQQNVLYIPIIILQHTTITTSVFTSPYVKMDSFRSVISMGQQSLVMYLSLKGLNAVEIHNDHVATLKGEAKSHSTVTCYLRKLSFSSPKTPEPSASPAPILNESDQAILVAHLKSLSRRCSSLRAEPTYTLPRSTTT
jgi:hypothetical protein